MLPVELLQQLQPMGTVTDRTSGCQVEHGCPVCPHRHALIHRREPTAGKVLGSVNGEAIGIQNRHVGGKILVLASQSVGNPGTQRRTPRIDESGVDVPESLFMVGMHGHHGTDHGNLVGVLGQTRKQFAEDSS